MKKSGHRWRPTSPFIVIVLAALIWTAGASGQEAKPKFGPNAIPIEQATGYLRAHPAPDYWALSPFYVPQDTDSACSAASIAMLLNALRGVPARNTVELVTQSALRAAVHDPAWNAETAQNGHGVTFAELVRVVAESLHAYALKDYEIETFRPADASHGSLAKLQRILAANERSSADFALLYFDQGVLTGDWDGPHISPIGAYDAARRRVLIMDVDRRFYVPYWSPVSKVLDSMLRPAPAKFSALAGETGGVVWVRPKRH